MKISVLMATRGRPTQMVAALHSLHSQESGKHEVTYGIASDSDDVETYGTCRTLMGRMNLRNHVLERTPSLGNRINLIAEHMPADVYVSVCDDTLCMSQDWDEAIAKAYAENDAGVWWWKMFYKEQATIAIISERWRKAAGRLYTDYFPYWFDDLWLLELWVLATESPFIYVDAKLGDYPYKTSRMRDLAFWHEFWHFTRPQRIKEAKEIAAKLGWPEPTTADAIATVIGRPVKEFVEDMENIEARQGEQGPPSVEYVKAKSRAQEIMGRPQDIVKMRDDFLLAIKPHMEAFDQSLGINR